jgi:hypothetical protein
MGAPKDSRLKSGCFVLRDQAVRFGIRLDVSPPSRAFSSIIYFPYSVIRNIWKRGVQLGLN